MPGCLRLTEHDSYRGWRGWGLGLTRITPRPHLTPQSPSALLRTERSDSLPASETRATSPPALPCVRSGTEIGTGTGTYDTSGASETGSEPGRGSGWAPRLYIPLGRPARRSVSSPGAARPAAASGHGARLGLVVRVAPPRPPPAPVPPAPPRRPR